MDNPSLAANAQETGKPTRQRHLLALILLIVVFFSYMDRVNVSILVADNTFLSDMGIVNQPVEKGMLMTVFLIAYGVGNVFLSPLGDILGARLGMSLAVIAWAISLVIGGLAPTFMMLLFSRVLLGLGEGMHFPLQSKFVKVWFPPLERGKANSVWQAGMMIAPAIAMPFFAWIIHITGWRGSFFALTALGIIPLILLWFYTADTPRQSKRINAAELEYIESRLQKETESQKGNTAEGKSSWKENFKSFANDPKFWLIVVYYIAHLCVIWGAMTWLPTYLKSARGFSWAAMGWLAGLPWFLGIATKFISGYLCDKIGRRAPIILFAMTGSAIGVYIGATVSDPMVSAMFLALGIGSAGLAGPAVFTLLQDIVPARGVATGAGIVNGVGNFFSSFAPIIIGFLIGSTGNYANGLFFIVGAATCGAIMMLYLTIKKY